MRDRRVSPSLWMALLTAGALVIVTAMAVQARDDGYPAGPAPGAREPSASPSADAPAPGSPSPGDEREAPLPGDSGDGRRVVYSLGQERVWLVDAGNTVARTFPVWPGTVSPGAGTYAVSFRRAESTGTDGAPIENIVYFAVVAGTSVAFSNAVDGASPSPPEPGVQTGGIRSSAEDGDALWDFADVGTSVWVVE
ncbi:hypothetical protein [Streptomyces sp. URMC 129]|uniref:L,D-transpeptidase n=1 Tax=Streptomyces sp. URMC 129 TaxID=3423407 RepID=UPI003F1A4C7F